MPLNSSTQTGWIYKLQRYKILNAIMDDFFFPLEGGARRYSPDLRYSRKGIGK